MGGLWGVVLMGPNLCWMVMVKCGRKIGMEQDIFRAIYLIGFVLAGITRLHYRLRARGKRIVVSYKTSQEILLLSMAFVGMVAVPLLFVFTSFLGFADYRLPALAGWSGTIVLFIALWLLWRSHVALGPNWSQTLELREGHQLITSGVYQHVRHPMYAAIWLWGIAQALLLHNWMAGWSHLVSFIPMYFVRVPREERMMIARFGEEYRAYVKRTPRIIPRWF